MIRYLNTLLFFILFSNFINAQDFITRWQLPAGQTTLTFNCERTGGAVNYIWQEMPSGASGSGSFTLGNGAVTITGLPSGANIQLFLSPTNLKRFYINIGPDGTRLLDVENWGTANWSSMQDAFHGCSNLNISASDIPNLSNVTSMSNMFRSCTILNSPSNIGSWNTSNVTNMSNMFNGSEAFNQPIGAWNTSAVTNMSFMFALTDFNQAIGAWNTSSVVNMEAMFLLNNSFNQPIYTWITSTVTNMGFMFDNAVVFNQNLGSWNLNANVSLTNMFTNCGMNCSNYSNTLIDWSNNPTTPNGRNLGALGLNYGTNAVFARTNLITNKNWTITGDIASGVFCSDDFITRWQLPAGQTTLTFNCERTGGAVNYIWQEMPSGASGSGSFAVGNGSVTISGLPSGANIKLFLSPTNLKRFYINNGPDRTRLLDVENWGTANWTSMEDAFFACSNLNISASDIPNLSNVSSMSNMFRSCTILNSPSNIGSWNTSAVTDMSVLFTAAEAFNQPIGAWNTSAVTNMSSMFNGADAFNQPLGTWNTSAVIDMSNMFFNTKLFNQPLGTWNTSAVTNMERMFYNARAFNQPISAWNTSAVTNMESMFSSAIAFNQPLNSWNTSAVTNMSGMFSGARVFNQAIDSWNTSAVTNMSAMFENADAFNQPIDSWNTSNVINMSFMFEDARVFNQSIGSWNTSNVINMRSMFENAIDFNQPIGSWNTSSVTNMSFMFSVFYLRQNAFNQPLNSWNTSNVTNMRGMFENADVFNQSLSSWNTSAVIDMRNMFNGTTAFNHSLADWSLNPTVLMTNMLDNSGMTCFNYSTTLEAWGNNPTTPNSRNLGALGLNYGTNAVLARTNLITNRNWTITGDIASGIVCSNDFITRWQLPAGQTTLTFNCERTGGAVNYIWQEMPSGASGSGSFAVGNGAVTISGLPSGANIKLFLSPTNLKRFYINNGTHRTRLQDVENWGTSNWSSMADAFYGCSNLNISANDIPNLSNVNSMSNMFRSCTILNSPSNINSWNTASVTSMFGMFSGADAFNQPINSWNTSAVTNMNGMFNSADAFNQPIGSWNTGAVLNMNAMFNFAISFNQAIDTWNLGSVTNLGGMFSNATAFNQPLNSWNTSNVTNMSSMFSNATAFNQSLSNWVLNPSVVLTNMLNNSGLTCLNYSTTLEGWSDNPSTPNGRSLGASGLTYGTNASFARSNLDNTKNWTITGDISSGVFCSNDFITLWQLPFLSGSTINFNCDRVGGSVAYKWQHFPSLLTGSGNFSSGSGLVTISGLPLTGGTIRLQLDSDNLNSFSINNGVDKSKLLNVENWGNVSWTSMENAFYGCSNLSITANDIPDLSNVNSMSQMFRSCTALNSPSNINTWNTSNVNNMEALFKGATAFNQSISAWNTNAVTNMSAMFENADAFNQPINSWNTSAVLNMSNMFKNVITFNQALNSWNTSAVTNMSAMFENADAFNQPLNSWNTSAVLNLNSMFKNAFAFNQALDSLNTSNVVNMFSMFQNSVSFNQNIGTWILNASVDLTNLLSNSGMDCENYSNTLSGWYNNNPSVTNRNLGSQGLRYGNQAQAARTNLINNNGWTITNDSLNNPLPSLVAQSTSTSGILECSVYLNPLDLSKKIIGIDANGNTFNPVSIDINNNLLSLPSGFSSSNGYYELHDATTTIRISNQLVSIVDPSSYSVNGGIKVRVYFPSNQISNMIADPTPVGSIVDYGWFKTDHNSAQATLNAVSTSSPFIALSEEIFPLTTGIENGIDYAEFLLSSFSTIGFFAKTNTTVLPIELINWEVNCIENQTQLTWTTATEINNDFFTIEKSVDAIFWEHTQTIQGAGNSSSNLVYSFVDKAVANHIVYYRLKQTDFDGTSTCSNIISSDCFNENIFEEPKLYPNPNSGIFSLECRNPIDLVIYSSIGELVYSNHFLKEGLHNINVSHLSEGVYHLHMKNNSRLSSIKFVIQH